MKTLIALACAASIGFAQSPSGDTILRHVDENMGSDTKVSTGQMRVQERREVRTIRMKSWLLQTGQDLTLADWGSSHSCPQGWHR